LGWVGVFVALLPGVLIYTIIRLKLDAGGLEKARDAHLRDFPQAVLPRP